MEKNLEYLFRDAIKNGPEYFDPESFNDTLFNLIKEKTLSEPESLELKQKILSSGIFKLDDKGQVIGIYELRKRDPQSNFKELYTSDKKVIPIENVSNLVDELTYQLFTWNSKSQIPPELLSRLEELTLKGYFILERGVPHTKLEPHFSRLMDKFKREKKKQSQVKTTKSIESAIHTRTIMDTFSRYADFSDKDNLIYTSYLLHSCELERGTSQQVYDRISARYFRTLKKIDRVSVSQ